MLVRQTSASLDTLQEAYSQMLSFTLLDDEDFVEKRSLLVRPSNDIWMPKFRRTPSGSHVRMKRTKVLSLLCSHPDILPSRHLRELCKKFTTASRMYARFAHGC
jgi:hypothetical protein